MRPLLLLPLLLALASCGQTGALYLPDEGVETPVEIRGPATPATPSAPPQDEEEEEDDEADAPAPPPDA